MVQQREKEPIKCAAAFISPVLTASSLYSNHHEHLCHDVWYPFKIGANCFPKLFCYRGLLCCCNKYYDWNKWKANRQAKPTQGGKGSFHLLSCSSWLEAETIEEYHILTCSLISAWLVSCYGLGSPPYSGPGPTASFSNQENATPQTSSPPNLMEAITKADYLRSFWTVSDWRLGLTMRLVSYHQKQHK